MNARWVLVPVLAAAAGCGPYVTVSDGNGGLERIPVSANTVKQLKEDVIKARAAEARATADRKANEAALQAAETVMIQSRLYWACGISIALAIGCFLLAVFVPGFKKWAIYGVLAFAAIAALCVLVAKLIPYLVWIGVAVAVILAIAAIYYWRLDQKSRDQIVAAIEDKREDINAKLPEMWDAFRKRVDTDSDAAIDWARARMGKLP